ncbi:zinc finger BED domain-containing protein RICESLEEPER 1-like [Setaria italica]|uniref:zinc finger BED domain-containing protein RICESLEEPER 1-like n=1 Tax=Setaria italica TaxID=4555 RepID=UPI0006464BE7|nr:zinc finger BED domain-containing protein RICESLEEPER 1-like [Setaria italica]
MDLGQEVMVEVDSRDSLLTDKSIIQEEIKAHLNRHIAIHYHAIPQEDRDRFIATLKPTSINEEKGVFDPEVFRILIAKYFISAEIAFYKANDPNWTNLINYCQLSFRVVGHRNVRTDYVLFYEEEKLQLRNKFRKVKSNVTLTTDVWSSDLNLGYLCVTAHLIDEEFELHKKIITFKKISFPYTSYAVQDRIASCLMEWELIDQLFTLTLDNASVNNRAVKDMHDALGVRMFFKGGHLHVKCATHVLNIIVQASFKVISNAIGRVRWLSTDMRYSKITKFQVKMNGQKLKLFIVF